MIIQLIILVISLVAYVYWKFRQGTDYWTRMGVKQDDPVPFPMGNNPILDADVIFRKINIGDRVEEQYNKFKDEMYFGTYVMPKCLPNLMINDPELIGDIMMKDFDHFVDRFVVINMFGAKGSRSRTDQTWNRQLASAKGEEWKDLRSMFSPIFTSGKLKTMIHLINLVSKEVVNAFTNAAKQGKEIEMREVFGNFAMDTMASCAFGVEAGSFKKKGSSNQSSQFVNNAKKIFTRNIKDGLCLLLFNVPVLNTILAKLGIPMFKPSETEFFYDVVARTLKDRLQNKTRRDDLIDLMIDAMTDKLGDEMSTNIHATEQFEMDSIFEHASKNSKDIDELTIVATAMVFLVAGYDMTAQTLSAAGFELAKNTEIQKRLQQEIDEAFDDGPDDADMLDYNVVQSLPYLDMVLHEALRLHSPAGFLSRACTKDYQLKGTNITIRAGQEVSFPVQGIHRDAKYYPDPLTFNPDNFSKEAKASRSPYTFLAFGQGPRSCIAMRFALLEAKIGLVSVLRSFNLELSDRTPRKLTRDPASILGNSLHPLYVKVEAR